MHDISIYKLIFTSLGATIVLSAVGMIGLSAADRKIPPELNSVAIGAIGVIGGILSPSPLSKKD